MHGVLTRIQTRHPTAISRSKPIVFLCHELDRLRQHNPLKRIDGQPPFWEARGVAFRRLKMSELHHSAQAPLVHAAFQPKR